MRKPFFTLWVLTVLLCGTDLLPAQQQGELYCAVTYKGQNRNRTVAGAVNVECGDGEIHTTPFGNWGVVSFYGGKTNTDQFRGWKHEDGPLFSQHHRYFHGLYLPGVLGEDLGLEKHDRLQFLFGRRSGRDAYEGQSPGRRVLRHRLLLGLELGLRKPEATKSVFRKGATPCRTQTFRF